MYSTNAYKRKGLIMLKVIGFVTLVVGAVVIGAVAGGYVTLDVNGKMTSKGEAKVQEARNSAADMIRGGADKVSGKHE